MPTVSVRWRSSGGRGEFEFVPAETLLDRQIHILLDPLNLTIPAEVRGVRDPAQGKPRLRKFEGNNRRKLHLPQLVMSIARLPSPARELHDENVVFPLRNGSFVMDEMDFEIIDDDGITVTLEPLRVSIRNSDHVIQLQDRLETVARDVGNIGTIAQAHPELAEAIQRHWDALQAGVNSSQIKFESTAINDIQERLFGFTNAASATVLEEAGARQPVEEEEVYGVEGRILTRIHVYKERDRGFVRRTKNHYRNLRGRLTCECCGLDPINVYGGAGERCLEAHHKIPIEELQPDSITSVNDMAIVCATCHRIIHSERPCIPVEDLADRLGR